VPAAAVIRTPIAYITCGSKLVVGLVSHAAGSPTVGV